MTKCDKCGKNITKSNPGLECNQCEKIVHLNGNCSGLTNKQRNALKAAENLGWTCQDCLEHSPRRSSIYVPGDGEEEDEEDNVQETENYSKNVQIDIKRLLKDISKEMEKALQRELRDIIKSLQHQSDKLDELTVSIDALKLTMKELQKKNIELANKNNYLETRVGALEQRIKDTEQSQLNKQIEILNIPNNNTEMLSNIVKKIADKLSVSVDDIESIKRVPGKKEKPGNIEITFKNETETTKWITAAKNSKLYAHDFMDNQAEATGKQIIYMREVLSYYNKKLLWEAKQKLKPTYKYVW
ncbi:unnamed protein product [Parnassius mnemosyne]|uniref:Uncharacterized protein n=1 Tax=Parnassius mnemosyne TaxID=213953 RepID=A0AAV1KAP3_9NEOP